MRKNAYLILVTLLALVLRLAPVLAMPDLGIGLDDMFQYDMLGRSLASGNGYRWYQPDDLDTIVSQLRYYTDFDDSNLPDDPRGIPTSFRAPGYPALLALVYLIFGLERRFYAARIVQAVIMSSLAPLTYGLARELGADERRSRLACLVPALWPMLALYPLGLASENLFIPVVTAGLLALFIAARRMTDASGGWRPLVVAGCLFGVATLTRSVVAPYALLAAAWLFWRGFRKQAMVLAAILFLFVTPWSIRNSLLHHKLIFVQSSAGYNLYLGYHPDNTGTFKFGISLDLIPILDDIERDTLGREMAWEFIKADPMRVPWLMVLKTGHLWELEYRAFVYMYGNGLMGTWPPLVVGAAVLLICLPLVLLMPPAVLGMAFGSRGSAWWLSLIWLAFYVGIHALIMAEDRFHLVLIPLLAGFAARGATLWPDVLADLRANRRPARWLAGVAAVVLTLLVLNWSLQLARDTDKLAGLVGPQGYALYLEY